MTDLPPTMLAQFDVREFDNRWPVIIAVITMLGISAFLSGSFFGGVYLVIKLVARAYCD